MVVLSLSQYGHTCALYNMYKVIVAKLLMEIFTFLLSLKLAAQYVHVHVHVGA